jgi:TatD DNase family protein
MLTDTHTHLDDPAFAGDLDAIIARAEAAGVRRLITIGTSVAGSQAAIAITEKYAHVYAVVGVHPNAVMDAPEDAIEQLRALAAHPRVVAIGEIGLDYHYLPSRELLQPQPGWLAEMPLNDPLEIEASIRDGACKSAQAALFEKQLELAVELGLNVVVHQREAWEDTLAILRPFTGKLRAVFHCFGEAPERALELVEMGHLVSFTGLVTFKNAELVRESVAALPADRFMVETDCPYLAPVPFRGKRSEPAHVALVAETVAKVRGQTLREIAAQTEETANGFFRFAR